MRDSPLSGFIFRRKGVQKIQYLVSLKDNKTYAINGGTEWYDDWKQNDPGFISYPAIEANPARLFKRHISDLTPEEVADLTRILLNIKNPPLSSKPSIRSNSPRGACA